MDLFHQIGMGAGISLFIIVCGVGLMHSSQNETSSREDKGTNRVFIALSIAFASGVSASIMSVVWAFCPKEQWPFCITGVATSLLIGIVAALWSVRMKTKYSRLRHE